MKDGGFLPKEIIFGHDGRILSPTDDAFIMNGLYRCGVECPTIFGLIWGDKMAKDAAFPSEVREIVVSIIQEEEKKEESLDPLENKLHGIIIDLLYVLYEKRVNDLVKRVLSKKRVG